MRDLLMLLPESVTSATLWCRALLLLGEHYREAAMKRRAASVRRAYWTNVDRKRAEARAYRATHRDDRNAYARTRYAATKAADPERHAREMRTWREQNATRTLANHLRRNYGITLDEYNRMLIAQGGCCGICGKRKGGGRGQSTRLHVDHDHATGKARGLLCGTCNRGIGQFNDNPRLVRAAVRYLERNNRRLTEESLPLVERAEDRVDAATVGPTRSDSDGTVH
jgi:hypothetical protein